MHRSHRATQAFRTRCNIARCELLASRHLPRIFHPELPSGADKRHDSTGDCTKKSSEGGHQLRISFGILVRRKLAPNPGFIAIARGQTKGHTEDPNNEENPCELSHLFVGPCASAIRWTHSTFPAAPSWEGSNSNPKVTECRGREFSRCTSYPVEPSTSMCPRESMERIVSRSSSGFTDSSTTSPLRSRSKMTKARQNSRMAGPKTQRSLWPTKPADEIRIERYTSPCGGKSAVSRLTRSTSTKSGRFSNRSISLTTKFRYDFSPRWISISGAATGPQAPHQSCPANPH